MTHPRADVTVERARVRCATPDSRAHLDAVLARVSPAAIGVPPGALLLVRRLKMRARLGAGARSDAFVADLQETLRARLAQARGSGDGDLLFRDEAELAAAVIASWLTGATAKNRDWWRVATAGAEPPSWWRQAILPDPRLLPRVVASLARRGLTEAWATRIDEASLRQATRMLAAAHGVTLAPSQPETPLSQRRALSPSRPAQAAQAAIRALVPEAARPLLTATAREWLTLALVLDRRPGLVATAGFAEALVAFAAGASVAVRIIETPRPRPAPPHLASLPVPRTRRRSDAAVPSTTAREAAATRTLPATATATSPRPETTVETAYGGIFFVLNALLATELYGDFTRPGGATPGIAPFDLLALLGRRWFGRHFTHDPVDALLATLGGRPVDEPAGRGFAPPPWRVHDAWLAPWPEAQPVDGWHPVGFPLDDRAAARNLPRRATGRWVASLAMYLQARLARALDTDSRRAVRTTCRQHARATLDGDRLTVTFALADHPLALRLAGLDRDPGYLPAARRDIAFVFA